MFNPATAGDYYRQGMGMRIADLERRVGGLTVTSKMPWLSYSLPASACKTGSKLRKVPGSVCSKCYACKGFYMMPGVRAAQQKRLEILFRDIDRWAGFMAALIEKKASNIDANRRYFRWHDSGDVQSVDHFDAITWIARITPGVRHYLPTKEIRYCFSYNGMPPSNFTVRHSMSYVGQKYPIYGPRKWATVNAGEGFQCPASSATEYKCGDCRACWDSGVKVVDYKLH